MTTPASITSPSCARAGRTRAEDWVGRWAGKTVVCIASGPSLIAEDCAKVKASGHPTIVTNTTFRMCPWAHVLFGFDSKWWLEYIAEVERTFHGALLTYARRVPGVGSLR